jgi:hypothetical protein
VRWTEASDQYYKTFSLRQNKLERFVFFAKLFFQIGQLFESKAWPSEEHLKDAQLSQHYAKLERFSRGKRSSLLSSSAKKKVL